jgi:hypothetical protein
MNGFKYRRHHDTQKRSFVFSANGRFTTDQGIQNTSQNAQRWRNYSTISNAVGLGKVLENSYFDEFSSIN